MINRKIRTLLSYVLAPRNRSSLLLKRAQHGGHSWGFSPLAGLYGLTGLHEPRHWLLLASDTVQRCQELMHTVVTATRPADIVQAIDDISDAICQVHDTAEFCRCTHPDPAWRHSAEEACISLQGTISSFNMDTRLYTAIQRALEQDAAIQSQQHQPAGKQLDETHNLHAEDDTVSLSAAAPSPAPSSGCLSEEGRHVARALLRDCERNGVHLPQGQREELAQLTAASLTVGMQIGHNINDPAALGNLPLTASELKGLHLEHQHGSDPSQLMATSSNCAMFLSWTSREDLRERVYRYMDNSPRANLALIQQLIELRRESARMLGEPSYAATQLQGYSLAGTPQAAEAFLLQQLQAIQPEVDEDLRRLLATKRTLHSSQHSQAVHIWDKWYLQQVHKTRNTNALLQRMLPYFPLSGVLDGLKQLLKQLMGLRVEEAAFVKGEGWAPNLRKWAVYDDDDGLQGHIYLDLHARQGKSAGAAHFTLRSRRTLTSCSPPPPGPYGSESHGQSYQLPLVALTLNFSASNQTLLSVNEVETLYHELGHALHSLLSRTQYQHMSGTRGAVDLIEVPSHWFERFALHPQWLAQSARHASTGHPMPEQLMASVADANRLFEALFTQLQVVLSLVDLRLHGSDPLPSGGVAEAVQQVFQQYSSLPPPRDCHPHLRLGHLVGYGGSYYSYRFATALTNGIWERLHKGVALNRAAGTHVRQHLLQPGGAKPAVPLVQDLLGASALQRVEQGFAPVLF